MNPTEVLSLSHGLAPWFSIPSHLNQAESIHFSPANGIPAGSYRAFFSELSQDFALTAMDSRGGWLDQPPPTEDINWHDLTDDLIEAITSKYDHPVIGMGHSIGGMLTLLAAAKRPELFSRLVIIDGASVPNFLISLFYEHIPKPLMYKMLPFIYQTSLRRKVWQSREEFVAHHSSRPTYLAFSDECMQDYAKAGLKERADGKFELAFCRDWESFNFRRVKYLWREAKRVSLPTLLIHAEKSILYNNKQFDSRKKYLPANFDTARLQGMDHLATHEDPKRVAELIRAWLSPKA